MVDTLNVLSDRVMRTGIYCFRRFVIHLGIDGGFVGLCDGCGESHPFRTHPHTHCGIVCTAVRHGRFWFAALCSPKPGRKSVYLTTSFHAYELIVEFL
jgi:hypothetical protein